MQMHENQRMIYPNTSICQGGPNAKICTDIQFGRGTGYGADHSLPQGRSIGSQNKKDGACGSGARGRPGVYLLQDQLVCSCFTDLRLLHTQESGLRYFEDLAI